MNDYLTGWVMAVDIALVPDCMVWYPPARLAAMNVDERRGFRDGKAAADARRDEARP